MSKIAQYLQQHLVGEVTSSAAARQALSTDASIFKITPSVIVYPRNENDVRKTARFSWQLAERGRVLPITARGAGTDEKGAALGSGIALAFPAHMKRILVLDNKTGEVSVEPGINFGKLQQTLQTHGRSIPSYPASYEYSTVGGAIANNASGDKSFKYGPIGSYVKSLRVVLANGEVIETGRITKRELNKKLGLSSFEGEVYRAIDSLLEDNAELVGKLATATTKQAAGYNLRDVKQKDGSFDLTPLFVGSQGTLAVVTEATLTTEDDAPDSTLFMACFDDTAKAAAAVASLRELPDMPSSLELVDRNLLELVHKLNPPQLASLPDSNKLPEIVLLAEFDGANERKRTRAAKKASKIFDDQASSYQQASDPAEQESLWKIRQASAVALTHNESHLSALPLVEDSAVPADKLGDYLQGIAQLFKKHNQPVAIWGHAGDGNLHARPFYDLAQLGDRQKAFKLMDDYYQWVISLGGSVAGESAEGRLAAPYAASMYGEELAALLTKVKTIFDPYAMLNPGVKTGTKLEDLKPLLRAEYSLPNLHQHLPYS
jgi:FAD/FMN-containing dehydrogenase